MGVKKFKVVLLLTLIALSAAVVGLWLLSALSTHVTSGKEFLQHSLDIQNNNLVDIGVVDFDGDGNLDIYTVAHHSAQSLLRGDGAGGFEDVFDRLGLDAQPEFPGVEISAIPPSIDKPGLYIYWSNSGLTLEWRPDPSMGNLSGVIELTSEVRLQESSGFEWQIDESRLPAGPPQSALKFEASSPGRAVILSPLIALPVNFVIGTDLDSAHIYIGRHAVNPPENSFTIFLNDRHGMAWADFNADGKKDVFISRGGLRGRMALLPYQFYDELFVWDSGRFVDFAMSSGLGKNGCPAYNAQWVDFDNDGHMDLYVACHHGYPNQFFRNNGSGGFDEIASEIGLDISDSLTDTPFIWIATGEHSSLDLLIASESGIQHLRRTGGRYNVIDVFPIQGVSQMSVSDFDSDGDLDVFVASYYGMNSILLNDGGRFELVTASALGLPASSQTVSWVDFDNDGNTDLFLVPGGLFRQTQDGLFEATGTLRHVVPWAVKRSRATWFDFNNDGKLDLVLAVNYGDGIIKGIARRLLGKWTPEWIQDQRNFEWDVGLFENIGEWNGNRNDWVQVELKGSKTNPEAVGATILLDRGRTGAVRAQVGQADGSYMSQGHYRLYFGIGTVERQNLSLHARWPDGKTTKLVGFDVNQLLSISYESGAQGNIEMPLQTN